MNFFSEYINSKGKIDKPFVKNLADKVDVPANKAKKPPKGHGQSNTKQYANGKKLKNATKGFGDEGDKSLIYNPEKCCKVAEIPTAESIKIVKIAANAIAENPFLAEHFISALKHNKTMGVLVGELFTHNEYFKHLAEVMANKEFGPTLSRKMINALQQEEVAPPYKDFGLDEFDDEDNDNDDELGMEDEFDDELGMEDDETEDPSLDDKDLDFLSKISDEDGEEKPIEDLEGLEDDDMNLGDMKSSNKSMSPTMENLIRIINHYKAK